MLTANLGDPACDAISCRFDGVVGEMSVSGGGLDLGVSEQLPNHGQTLADQQPTAGEAVTKIVDAHVVKPGARGHAARDVEGR